MRLYRYKLRIVATLIFIITLIVFFQCSYSSRSSLELLNDAARIKYDMVVIPGVPFEDGKWSKIMRGRIYWSKYLYDKGVAKNIMYSGSAVYTPYIEAEIMAIYAEAIGIPKEHIFIETRAEHSTENIFYSYKKARKLGFKTVALASDPFQAKMLSGYTHEFVSEDIGIIPFVVDTLSALHSKMKDPDIDYQKAFVPNFVSLPDRQSWWERLRGTRGLHVDMNAYN